MNTLKAHSQVWDNFSQLIKNAFYFNSKGPFAHKIFKFLSWHFGHVLRLLDQKDKANFKFYDVTQNLQKYRQSDNEIWSVNRM